MTAITTAVTVALRALVTVRARLVAAVGRAAIVALVQTLPPRLPHPQAIPQ